MAIDWRQNNVDYGTGRSEQAREGMGNFAQQAKAKGYTGSFVSPYNYADPSGINFSQATDILQGGFSGQNQGNIDYQDALRQAAQARLGGLQNNAADRKAAMTTDLEQGFKNQADILRRSAAGTGAQSSLGYGRAAGDISNQFQQNLDKSLLNVDTDTGNQLSQLSGIGSQLNQSDLSNREFDYGQSKDLANMYLGRSGVEQGNEQFAAETAAQATAARKAAQNALIGSILQTAGTVGGAAIGKPPTKLPGAT
jgi:hypothetical protein